MKLRLRTPLLTLSVVLAGCNQPHERLNAPPHGSGDPHPSQGTYVYMADNALLADMCVMDTHFLPGRAMLNGSGHDRLSRLAQLVDAYGGTIRFSTNEGDEALIASRLSAIRDFLAHAGVDAGRTSIVRDHPGGEGMAASEAILIKSKKGTFDPDAKSNTSTSGGSKAGASGDSKDEPK